jgi:hypothetical protein
MIPRSADAVRRPSSPERNMAAATVRYQPTPNPNAGKFTLDRTVVAGDASKSYYSAAEAAADPLARALFALDGVASLFMVADFVTVTKRPDAEWSALVPAIVSTLEGSIE